MSNDFTGFHIMSHTRGDKGGFRAGYHCTKCGCFYAEGNFSIENATHVLGVPNVEWKTCCGEKLPTPRLFETIGEARDFLSQVGTSSDPTRATLIKKTSLVVAHFHQKTVMDHKRKVLH